MTPFEPIGDHPRWKTIYDLLRTKHPGDILTYTEMGEALNLDPATDLHAIQMAMRDARDTYLENERHAVKSVPRTGYRISTPPEHLCHAGAHQARATREIVRGAEVVTHVDLNELEPVTRRAMMLVAESFQQQRIVMAHIDVRQKRLEEALLTVAVRTERTGEEVSDLKDRLERLESRMSSDRVDSSKRSA
jgi:hypothetical protein